MTKITMIIDVVNYNYDDGDDVAFLSDVTTQEEPKIKPYERLLAWQSSLDVDLNNDDEGEMMTIQ